MNTKTKRKVGSIVYNVIVCFFGLIMLYPLVWMVMSSFKETSTIFTTAGSLIPEKATLENYVNGWKGFGKVSFGTFFSNSMFISVIATVGTVISSSLVAYGFSRCKFKGRGLLFAAMLVSMMLPAQVLMIPQYLWYQKLGWVGTYLHGNSVDLLLLCIYDLLQICQVNRKEKISFLHSVTFPYRDPGKPKTTDKVHRNFPAGNYNPLCLHLMFYIFAVRLLHGDHGKLISIHCPGNQGTQPHDTKKYDKSCKNLPFLFFHNLTPSVPHIRSPAPDHHGKARIQKAPGSA